MICGLSLINIESTPSLTLVVHPFLHLSCAPRKIPISKGVCQNLYCDIACLYFFNHEVFFFDFRTQAMMIQITMVPTFKFLNEVSILPTSLPTRYFRTLHSFIEVFHDLSTREKPGSGSTHSQNHKKLSFRTVKPNAFLQSSSLMSQSRIVGYHSSRWQSLFSSGLSAYRAFSKSHIRHKGIEIPLLLQIYRLQCMYNFYPQVVGRVFHMICRNLQSQLKFRLVDVVLSFPVIYRSSTKQMISTSVSLKIQADDCNSLRPNYLGMSDNNSNHTPDDFSGRKALFMWTHFSNTSFISQIAYGHVPRKLKRNVREMHYYDRPNALSRSSVCQKYAENGLCWSSAQENMGFVSSFLSVFPQTQNIALYFLAIKTASRLLSVRLCTRKRPCLLGLQRNSLLLSFKETLALLSRSFSFMKLIRLHRHFQTYNINKLTFLISTDMVLCGVVFPFWVFASRWFD